MSTYLSDIFSVYFHCPFNNNWDISEYTFITNISTVEDYIKIYKIFYKLFEKGYFFIFRDYIEPRFEDKENCKGGCFSIKVSSEHLYDFFFKIVAEMLGETLTKDPKHSLNINGISISPKKNSNIIRIWIKDNSLINRNLYNFEDIKYSSIIYKKHINE